MTEKSRNYHTVEYLYFNHCILLIHLQEGRTPLHYASALKGTTSGVNQLYDILVDNGADENVVDVVSY